MATLLDSPKQRLLDAAIETFAEKGYAATPVRDICRHAGVNVAAVNYYFGDKERLYIEAVKQSHACMADTVPFPEWPADASPHQKLSDFIETLVARMFREPNPHVTQLIMRELAHPTAACAEMVRENVRPMSDLLQSILAELLPTSTVKDRYLIGFSIVGQCLFYKQNRPVVRLLIGEPAYELLTPAEIADHVKQFTFHGLAARGLTMPVEGKR